MTFERARTDEQIQKRKLEIIEACAELYDKYGIDGVHFKAIGELTTFSRSAIYKYYSTKEEVLLDLLIEDIKSWVGEIIKIMETNHTMTKEAYCLEVTKAYVSHKRMLKLMSIMYSILEENSSLEKLADFKRELLGQTTPFVESLTKFFPKASPQDCETFMYFSFSFVMGLYPSTHKTDKQIEAVKLSGMKYEPLDFSELCYKGLLMLMADL